MCVYVIGFKWMSVLQIALVLKPSDYRTAMLADTDQR